MRGKFNDELSRQCEALLDDVNPYAVYRYSHYRRRRMAPADAFDAAMAWGRNVMEQRERDYSHDTGAVA